jgi:D-alanyl-D-alanine carboxypeptidase
MNWEVHVDGRRYRLRNKRLFSVSLIMLTLFTAGVICIVVGILSDSGNASAPLASAPGAQGSAAAASDTPASAGPSGTPSGKPPANVDRNDWRLTLVNADHPLPQGVHVETRGLPNGLAIDARAYDDLMDMIDDGQRQGLDFVICSAYRSYEKQQELYDDKVSRIQRDEGKSYEQAYEEARQTVAFPGTSEHQLGLAVDIVAYDYQQLDDKQLDTPECKWLVENSWKYGFIMRYPQDKKLITKIIFEPWHYRYVGYDAAKAIHESGQCLEEYLDEAD